MKLKRISYFILSSAVFGLIISSCNHFNSPTSVWNPDQKYAPGAVISRVLPVTTAIAGVREITIVGRNFSKVLDSNWVWFGAQQAIVKSASVDTLVAYRPPNSGSLTLKVIILAAIDTSTIPYNLEPPVSTADLSSLSSPLAMEADKNDTMWIATGSASAGGYIYKLSPDGTSLTQFKDSSYFKSRINKKATDFANAFIDLKFGPGGFLYATFNSKSTSNTIYQIKPDTTVPVVYATLSKTKSVGFFDFDEHGNIYTGNTNGLYFIKTDGTSSQIAGYSGITFGEVRVIKEPSDSEFVYVATSTGLFKSSISSPGILGAKQQVANIATDTNFTANNKISSFNVASDGTILISVTGGSTYSLYLLQNGVLTPYYHDNILPTGIDQLIWGGDRYLYLSRGKTGSTAGVRFYKMGVAKDNDAPMYCAPYFGRGL